MDSGIRLSQLNVIDGGMAVNSQLLQFLSDILDTKVLQPKYHHTTAAGEAYAAGLRDSLEEITKLWVEGKRVSPDISEEAQL
jgi:glycerol kinase